MSDATNEDAAYDARMIDEIRHSRAAADNGESWSLRLTLGEIDALLRAADERDRLRHEFCDMPDEMPHRPAVTLDPLRDELGLDLDAPAPVSPAWSDAWRSSLEHDEPIA